MADQQLQTTRDYAPQAEAQQAPALPDYGPNSDYVALPATNASDTPYLDEAGAGVAEQPLDWDLGESNGDCIGIEGVPQDPSLAKFLAMTFARTAFQPSTGLGAFDVSYVPASGQVTATVNLELFFVGDWSDEERAHYVAEFRYTIESLWNATPAPIRCVKPGWEQVVATPRIVANAFAEGTGSAAPHDQVTIRRGNRAKGGPDNYRPPLREGLWGPDQLDLDEGQVDDRGSGEFVTETELARVKAILGPVELHAAETDGQWLLDGASGQRLPELGRAMGPQMPSTPPVPVAIVGWGGMDGMAEVTEGLTSGGATNLLRPGWDGNAPGKLSFLVDPDSRYTSDARTDFNLVAHEFGHMLGLGDEYESAGPEGHPVSDEQKQLVDASGADAHVMDEDTTSVMSMGKDVLPDHYVTVWEALTKLTGSFVAPSEWRL